jgi:hypothetical protein
MIEHADRPRWPAMMPALLVVIWLAGLIAVVVRSRPGVGFLRGAERQSEATAPSYRGPTQLDDPRLDSLRLAAEHWRTSLESRRQVVDQVCLVPDVASFFEAITLWDERHFFPILIDEPAHTLPFLRAFRPAQVIRYERATARRDNTGEREKLPPETSREQEWFLALEAVARAWSSPSIADLERPVATLRPRHVGPRPPGVVLTGPEAPMFAGAVALAAGRFQPLVRMGTLSVRAAPQDKAPPVPRGFGDVLTYGEAGLFAQAVEARVSTAVARHDRLDDDCDFVTLAGDWPYRYAGAAAQGPLSGLYAVDDLVGRVHRDRGRAGGPAQAQGRWAYAGRLLGDPAESVARAMSALFLQPASALFWNTYHGGDPWSEYALGAAADLFGRESSTPGAVVHEARRRADLPAWNRAVGPVNRFGFIFLNSSGGPRMFTIAGGPGRPADLPRGTPAAVAMIHSFSAADPTDLQTIAGRWLAQGAFVFYGSMNEPFLHAFRPPRLVADLIEAGAPLVAALRQGESEPFGFPWRLVYLGDPLYRPWIPRARRESQPLDLHVGPALAGRRMTVADWRALAPEYARWPIILLTAANGRNGSSSGRRPFESDDDRLRWCRDAAIGDLSAPPSRNQPARGGDGGERGPGLAPAVEWLAMLRSMRRDRLTPPLRPVFDDLLIDTLEEIGALDELQARLASIPPDECGSRVWLAMERCAVGRLAGLAVVANQSDGFTKALDLWDVMIRVRWPKGNEFPAQLTERLAALVTADPLRRRGPWVDRLSRAADSFAAEPDRFFHAHVVEAERTRIDGLPGGRAQLTPGSP